MTNALFATKAKTFATLMPQKSSGAGQAAVAQYTSPALKVGAPNASALIESSIARFAEQGGKTIANAWDAPSGM